VQPAGNNAGREGQLAAHGGEVEEKRKNCSRIRLGEKPNRRLNHTKATFANNLKKSSL
jgi:hypothetical protein